MAKKNKGTFSYLEAQQALENIAEKCTKENIVYELLRIFSVDTAQISLRHDSYGGNGIYQGPPRKDKG